MKDIIAALDILNTVDFDQNVTVIFADRDGFNRFKAVEMQLSRSQNRVLAIIPYITDHLPEIENALHDEQRGLLNKILDAQSELDIITELDSFIVGFRLGATFTYDTFVNTDTPYRDMTEKL